MLQKIAKIITNNFGLKILAVVISVVFWLVIVNVEDPEKTLTFTVQVNIENADYLTNQGKTYEILNGSDTIKFTATAKRSIIEKMTDGDFEVTADLKDIVNMSEVPITITPTKYSNQITLTKKTMYVQLNVEDLVTKSFDLKVDTKGKISNGYTMSGLEVTPSKVTVSGPASVIESIERAAVEVDVSSIYSDFEKEKNAYALYEEKRNECYKFVNKIESGLLEAKESIHELEKNYILDDYTITIEDDYNQFQSIVDDLAEITKIIETKDFSYIEMIDDRYDYIIVDCSPNLGQLTLNALVAADEIIIPVQAAYLSIKGLEQLLKTISRVKRKMNPKLHIMGILLTMVDYRTNYANEITDVLYQVYGNSIHIFENVIPMSVRAAETPAEGISIYKHDAKGKVAQAYETLTQEVINRE